MALFDSVEDKYHECWMDNLYNSASFCKKAFSHEKKAVVPGVKRKWMCGIPRCMKQELVENNAAQQHVQGTVKVSVLEGNKDCPNLVACSVYNTKPVHFLFMLYSNLGWQWNDKVMFNVETGLTETMQFLH